MTKQRAKGRVIDVVQDRCLMVELRRL